MEMKNSAQTKSSERVKEMVQISLLTALTYLAVSFINIPNGNFGVIHLGDSMIIVAAILFGKKHGAIAGGIGMAMFDFFSPYAIWTPYTLIIKGIMGFIVGSIAFSGKSKGNNGIKNSIAIIIAGVWMIVGYYFAEAVITNNILLPIQSVIGNIIQITSGGIIGILLAIAIKKTGYFNN